jgi:hypothetical protein
MRSIRFKKEGDAQAFATSMGLRKEHNPNGYGMAVSEFHSTNKIRKKKLQFCFSISLVSALTRQ